MSDDLRVEKTAIPGLLVVRLPLHGDNRGWFKENWQRQKMVALGLPDFTPIQNNISFNDAAGTTRGIHAEPWDKYISVASGRIFGAWVDLRSGPSFGQVVTVEVGPETAVFVPRGVGNAYQTLEDDTAYTYLVNAHWSPDAEYCFLNLADETVAVPWPIPLDSVELSDKDRAHPRLADVHPISPRKTLVIGALGQLGRALQAEYRDVAGVEYVDQDQLDICAPLEGQRDWGQYGTIINAAAMTAVDVAETEEGRKAAWAVNATAVSQLAKVADEHDITLVHVSSDYVFDGSATSPQKEDDSLSPLGVYGQTKAAGDLAALCAPRSYVVRTSWVIGDGGNFVRTMASLADRGIAPKVVADQVGRLTFTEDLARAIRFLVDTEAAYGVYNVTGSGEEASWADIAARVYQLKGYDPDLVTPVTTEQYYEGATGPLSPRPPYSVLDLTKIRQLGFEPRDQYESLEQYVAQS